MEDIAIVEVDESRWWMRGEKVGGRRSRDRKTVGRSLAVTCSSRRTDREHILPFLSCSLACKEDLVVEEHVIQEVYRPTSFSSLPFLSPSDRDARFSSIAHPRSHVSHDSSSLPSLSASDRQNRMRRPRSSAEIEAGPWVARWSTKCV